MRVPGAVALLAVLLGAGCAPVPPRDEAVGTAGAVAESLPRSGYAIEPFRWQADSTPQRRIVASNPYGDVRVRTTRRGALAVSAMVQHIGARELEVRVDERHDTVVVAVHAQTTAPRSRVDVTLLVPPGREVDVTTRDGVAEVKYRGDVRVRTRTGAITVLASGLTDLASESGTIVTGRP